MSPKCILYLYHLTTHNHNLFYEIWLINKSSFKIIFLIKLPKTSLLSIQRHIFVILLDTPLFFEKLYCSLHFSICKLKNLIKRGKWRYTEVQPKLTSFKQITGTHRPFFLRSFEATFTVTKLELHTFIGVCVGGVIF